MNKLFLKVKAIVLGALAMENFTFSNDGKLELDADQKTKFDELTAEFGEGFKEKFTAALEKELKDESANEAKTAAEELVQSISAASNKKIKALQDSLDAQTTSLNEMAAKVEKMAKGSVEDLEGDGAAAKVVPFKVNMKLAHNVIADAYLAGNSGPLLSASTIDVSDLKTEFGTYLNQKDKPILKALTQKTFSEQFMTTKMAITEWRATQAIITSVVQQFTAKWTPLGSGTFTAIKIVNRRHKINVPVTPDDINDSWISHLYDESLTPQEMPVVKFLINELVLPKVEEDMEMRLLGKGVYESAGNPADGDAGQATGKSMDGFLTLLVKEYEDPATKINFNKLGIITDANIIDKMNAFVDGMDELYQQKEMNMFTSLTRYKQYKRKYQDLYPITKGDDKNNDVIDFSNNRLQVLPSMSGSSHFFTTPKENFIALRHKNQDASKIWMQSENYDVKIFAEWWKSVGFAIAEAVFAYIDPIAVINGYAVASVATNLQLFMLADAEITGVVDANLAAYKVAVAAEAGIASQAALQAIVDAVNIEAILATINGYAVANDATALTIVMLTTVGCTGVLSANLAAYKVAVAAEAGIADLAALQAVVDAVNAAP